MTAASRRLQGQALRGQASRGQASRGQAVDPVALFEVTVLVCAPAGDAGLEALLGRVSRALAGFRWQGVVVAQNPTGASADQAMANADPNARAPWVLRIARRGLSNGVLDVALASATPFVAVISADPEHDERLSPQILETLRREGADWVVASQSPASITQACAGGSRRGRRGSLAKRLAPPWLKTRVEGPALGLFMIRRAALDGRAPHRSPKRFKRLFEAIASGRGSLQLDGTGRLDGQIRQADLERRVCRLATERLWRTTWLFAAAAAAGVVVHRATLRGALGLGFQTAQILAAFVAMTVTSLTNHAILIKTGRGGGDRSRRDGRRPGTFIGFGLLLGVGVTANAAVASIVKGHNGVWWKAGASGAAAGAGWTYLLTTLVVF